jgi:hypothetical protein
MTSAPVRDPLAETVGAIVEIVHPVTAGLVCATG